VQVRCKVPDRFVVGGRLVKKNDMLGLEIAVFVDELAQTLCDHLSIIGLHTAIEVEP
jgi:hypothetical protein